MARRVFWPLWCLALAAWTAALLAPEPDELAPVTIPSDFHFPLSKTLHLLAYAVLACPVSRRRAWWAVGVLALHGAATEALQTTVSGRYGSVQDVLIDWTGIALGVALSRLGWPAGRS